MFPERKRSHQDYVAKKSYSSGLLTGVVAGLAAGLLFAPRPGKDLRRQIAGAINDQTREVRHQWAKTKAQAKETVHTIITNVGLAADKAEDEFDIYVDKAVKYADKATKEADKAEQEANQLANKVKSGINKFGDNTKIS